MPYGTILKVPRDSPEEFWKWIKEKEPYGWHDGGHQFWIGPGRIHLYQARSCNDSWWQFYLRYAYYWLAALPHTHHFRDAGYRLNPFEMEAYANQHNLHYLDDKQAGANQWRTYARMSLRERRKALGTIKSAACSHPSQCQTVHPSEHHPPQTVSPSE